MEYQEQKGEKLYLCCSSQKRCCYDRSNLNTTHKQETARICVRKRRIQEFTLRQENGERISTAKAKISISAFLTCTAIVAQIEI